MMQPTDSRSRTLDRPVERPFDGPPVGRLPAPAPGNPDSRVPTPGSGPGPVPPRAAPARARGWPGHESRLNAGPPGADDRVMSGRGVLREPVIGERFADIVSAALDGSAAACQQLYEAFAGRVCGYLRLHGAAEPDDLTSEVFLRVFKRLEDFVGDEAGFRAWLFTIAHHLLLDERRRRSRTPDLAALSEPMLDSVAGGDVEDDALDSLAHGEIAGVLAELSPDQRDVLTLRVIADLDINQVAQILRKRPNAVKALQHRGTRALRRLLEEIETCDTDR